MVFSSLPCRSGKNPCCFGESCLSIYTSAGRPVLPLDFTPLFQGTCCLCVLQPVQVLGPRLDFSDAKDWLSLLLSLVQAYRLLSVMSAAVPQLPGRWPLYSEIERENSMYVLAVPTLLPCAADCVCSAQLSASKDLHAACSLYDHDRT